MMTWFPNMSMFDSAEALELPQLYQTFEHSESLFNELVFGDMSDGPFGNAPVPLRLMWTGYETYLAAYTAACAAILVSHGITTGVRAQAVAQTVAELRRNGDPAPLLAPPWLSDVDVLRSHRSNLMRRWPESYSWPNTPTDMPYLWPVVDGEDYVLKLSKYDRGLIAAGDRSLPKKIMERISS